ncbi:MAG: MerR family transcriptional regulator [Nitratireductor sp.]
MTDSDDTNDGREKSADAFRTISEVAEELDTPQHVLRFWETKFAQVKPMKRAGGRRYYRPDDVALLKRIRDLLYSEGFTIRGVQKLLRERGARALIEGEVGAAEAAAPASASATTPPPATTAASEPASEDAPQSGAQPGPQTVDADARAAAAPADTPPHGADRGLSPEARARMEAVRRRLLQLRESLAEGLEAGA